MFIVEIYGTCGRRYNKRNGYWKLNIYFLTLIIKLLFFNKHNRISNYNVHFIIIILYNQVKTN